MARHGENIYKRKDGRWVAKSLEIDESGKKYYKYYYGSSYEIAKEKRRLGKSEKILEKNEIKFVELSALWLSYKKGQVKESTFSKYSFYVQRYINEEFGDLWISIIDTNIIDSYAKKLLEQGSLISQSGLSSKMVNNILSIVKLILTFGQERGFKINENCKVHYIRESPSNIKVLTMKEQKILETYILDHLNLVNLGIYICLYTGLRIGEICGLKWEDIDFESGILYVRRTIMRIQTNEEDSLSKTKLLIDIPKTQKSYRFFPIPSILLRLLKDNQGDSDCFILTGEPICMEPRNLFRYYQNLLKVCHIKSYPFHAMRHTFATRCIELGFDAKTLSEILGHADVQVTLRNYVFVSNDLKRKQLDNLIETLSEIKKEKIPDDNSNHISSQINNIDDVN